MIVVNDNGRSYAPTIGGFADHLAGLRLQPGYERVLDEGRKAVRGVPLDRRAVLPVPAQHQGGHQGRAVARR